MSPQPDLSVVVALVSGAPQHLRTCLTALRAQDLKKLEILVPYDAPVSAVTDLGPEFPEVRFIFAKGLETAAARSGSSREHHDQLRTLGLRQARGRVVALLEDVGSPCQGWASGLLAALERHPNAGAVGGAMACGSRRALNKAVCLADFWRYQPPLDEAVSSFASDANIAYRRAVLEALRDVWQASFHETVVNAELGRRGHELWLAPAAKVLQQRSGLGWLEALRERFVWGRSYAGTRVRDVPLLKRLVYAAFCPALPPLLTWRLARSAWSRGAPTSHWLPSLPLVSLLFGVWSFGEAVGYLTGTPD